MRRADSTTPDEPSRCKAKPLVATIAMACAATLSPLANAAGKVQISDSSFITVGAGLRTQTSVVEDSAPDGDDSFDTDLSNIRLYVGGQVNDTIKFTFNTERWDNEIDVLDAIAQFEFSPHFNLWAGLMLTPADRIEMNGPFYGLTWNQFTQPLFASDQDAPNDGIPGQAGSVGRDTGITAWGSFNKFQYAIGVFDGVEGGPNTSDNPLFAGRFAYNFLNMEQNPAYYTSSTYYGGLGNVLTLGISFQSQEDGVGSAQEPGDFTGYTIDLLSETVFEAGVLTLEAEFKDFDSDFTGLGLMPAGGCEFCLFDGESYFGTVAYLFNNEGPGQFQPYVRFVKNDPSDGDSSDLTELGLNYVIDGHNARLNFNYGTGDANISGFEGEDVDSFSIGVQIQI